MKIVTLQVSPDEPCWGLRQGPRLEAMPDGSRQRRWVERTYVIRGDAVAEFSFDCGPVEDWPDATETVYPSFGENSVGELRWLAERDRNSTKWADYRKRLQSESTLIADVLRQEEENSAYIHNRSVFGPAVNKQRNVYDSNPARRKLRDRRKDYSGIIPQGGK